MKLKVGTRVVFIDETAHEKSPGLYPPVGTVGEIVKRWHGGAQVMWLGREYPYYVYIEQVEEVHAPHFVEDKP